MAKYEITAELNLKNLILKLREVSQALNECADKLLMIEIKYDKEKLDDGKTIDLQGGKE